MDSKWLSATFKDAFREALKIFLARPCRVLCEAVLGIGCIDVGRLAVTALRFAPELSDFWGFRELIEVLILPFWSAPELPSMPLDGT